MTKLEKTLSKHINKQSWLKEHFPKVAAVHTKDDYISIPENERTSPFFFNMFKWYVLPQGLTMDFANIDDWLAEPTTEELKKNQSWPGLYYYLRTQYPVQYFLRKGLQEKMSKIFRNKYIVRAKWKIKDGWYKTKCFFFPRHPLLKKVVKNELEDLVTIIPNFLFTAIIEYVELEDGLKMAKGQTITPKESINMGFTPKELIKYNKKRRKFAKELDECYKWAKIGKNKLEKEINIELMSAKKLKTRMYELEKLLVEKDKEFMRFIVDNYDNLWT